MASQAKVTKVDSAGQENLMQAIQKIDEIQGAIDKINDEASEEILKVEQRFNKMRQPHYSERANIITHIPKFWLTCFLNHPQISTVITEKDEQILSHVVKLDVQEFDDIKSGYRISLHFEKNSFFTNEVLTKEYHLGEGGEPSFTTTPVSWNPGMEPSGGSGANGGAAAGNKRKAAGDAETGGFLAWLTETDPLGVELGEIIKDDLWPNPLQYFLNNELEGDDDENSEEDIGEGDEEILDEEEEEDEEEA
jgi:template-activating factor I